MELNIWALLYLAYRVAPMMIVIYFIFASVINQDLKGLVYLVGLIFTCFLVQLFGNSVPADWVLYDIELNSPVCNSFSIGQNGYYSNKFPFSIVVFSFTFFYIFYIIYTYGLIFSNIPFMILFPVLITFDIAWNKLYKCANFFGMAIALCIGSAIGYGWAAMIDATGLINLTYMSGGLNNEMCKIAAQTQYKCTLRQVV